MENFEPLLDLNRLRFKLNQDFSFFFLLVVEVEDRENNTAPAAPDTTRGFISLLCLLASPAVIKGTLMLHVCSAYSSVFVCSLVNRISSTCTPPRCLMDEDSRVFYL